MSRPQTHSIFIKCCQKCTGIVTFVYSWNKECEDGLKISLVALQQAEIIENLKSTISSINGVVSMQQSEIARLETKIKTVEDSNTWFNKWGSIQDSDARIKTLSDKLNKALERAGMTYEDKVSTTAIMLERNEKSNEELRSNEKYARISLEEYKKDVESDIREKRVMAARAKEQESKMARLEAENAEMRAMLLDNEREHKRLNDRINQLNLNEKELLNAIETKETKFLELQATSNASIESLQNELTQISEEYSRKEEETDKLRDELKETQTKVEEIIFTQEAVKVEYEKKEKVISYYYYFFIFYYSMKINYFKYII